jgi:hypothetical protein
VYGWREVTINQKLASTFRLGGHPANISVMPNRSARLRMLPATAVVAVWVLVGASPSTAQSKGGQQARPPRVIVVPNDIYRPPPAPPERYVVPPRSGREISPPMPRPEPLPPMAPRIGN